MLPTANFEPLRCTLLSVKAFDFDNNLCSFAVNENANDISEEDSVGVSVTRCERNYQGRYYDVELRKQHVSRTRDRFAWRILQRSSSIPKSQVGVRSLVSSRCM